MKTTVLAVPSCNTRLRNGLICNMASLVLTEKSTLDERGRCLSVDRNDTDEPCVLREGKP
jgi:hypothetical protein